MIHISSGLTFHGDSESAVRKVMSVKLDSAIADVPTDENVSTSGIH
jgi:hypothetical protein